MQACSIWAKNIYVKSHNKPIIILELQLSLRMHIDISCCSFIKYW